MTGHSGTEAAETGSSGTGYTGMTTKWSVNV